MVESDSQRGEAGRIVQEIKGMVGAMAMAVRS
jgi:hypothetical protein